MAAGCEATWHGWEAERVGCLCLADPLFIHSGTSAHGKARSTFRMSLLASVKSLWEYPPGHPQTVLTHGDCRPSQVHSRGEPLQYVIQVQSGAGLLTTLRRYRFHTSSQCLGPACPPVSYWNSDNCPPLGVYLLQASIFDGKPIQITCVYLKSVNKGNCPR